MNTIKSVVLAVTLALTTLTSARADIAFSGTALQSAISNNPLNLSIGQVGIFINNNNNANWASFTNGSISSGLSLFSSATYTPIGTSQSYTFLTNSTVTTNGPNTSLLLAGAFNTLLSGGVSQGDEFAVLVFNSSTTTTIAGDTFRIFRGTQAAGSGGWIMPSDPSAFGYTTNTANFAANVQQIRSTSFLVQTGTVVPEPSTYALLAMSGIGLAAYAIRRRRRA